MQQDPQEHSDSPSLSFVVIGYNEGAHLEACLHSVKAAFPPEHACEVIYVDGGSSDASLAIAQEVGVDQVLGGDQQRRAAENRNLGLAQAHGEFIQFVDGDMLLDPHWPQAALTILAQQPEVAVVFGQLRERNQNLFYRALQIDWIYPEGPALYCGGAALFRREALMKVGGFPEDVAYGEEPLLCWRLRNQEESQVYHLHHRMADHDLAYTGLPDYWRRSIRCGETYAEIAQRCRDSQDPFWSAEIRTNLRWFALLAFLFALLLLGPCLIRFGVGLGLSLILIRKTLQQLRAGHPFSVALVYALHTYLSKLSIGWGILKWKIRHAR